MSGKPTRNRRGIGCAGYTLLVFCARGLCFWAVLCCFARLAAVADETVTSSPPAWVQAPDTNSQQILQAIWQLQGQLRSNELALQQGQEALRQAAARNEVSLSNGLQHLEHSFLAQQEDLSARSAHELEAMQSSNRSTLRVAVAIASIAFAAMLVSGFFQWRATRLWAGIPEALSGGRARRTASVTAPGPGSSAAASAGSIEDSSLRFLGLVEQLDKRIQRLEQSSKPVLGISAADSELKRQNVHGSQEPQVPMLLTQGQAKLKENDPEAALNFFDQALELSPNCPEALVRKGTVLERLNRVDEALACYERAVAVDPSMTSAYLHKGSLYNRLERLREALACYEQALQCQDSHGEIGA